MDGGAEEDRLVSLETALAHQQAEIQDLSDMIARQWETIDGLGRRLDRVEALLQRLLAEAPGDEPGGPTGP